MADISKITLPSGTTYDIKDTVAREASSVGLQLVVVDALPTAGASTMGKMYLIPDSKGQDPNVKIEYVTVRSGSEGSYTYKWEQVGTSATDLSAYAKKGDSVTVSAHSVTDGGHTHTVSGTTTADGTNAASAVTFGGTTETASKLKSAGSAGTMTTLDTSKFNGGTPTAVTLPTFTQGTDEFTANTPTAVSVTAGSAASLSNGFYTAGSVTAGTAAALTTSVSGETLTIGWTANTPTAVTMAAVDTSKFNGGTPTTVSVTPGTAASFTQGTDTHTGGSVTAGSAASLGDGFYTAGTAPTMPTFDSVTGLHGGSTTGTAAAQTFTGKSSAVTGTAASATTGVTIANHTATINN